MERKAVFFDIDGTLYNTSIGVPESAVQGIRELKKMDILILYQQEEQGL